PSRRSTVMGMRVDSYAFLPRSFRAMYAEPPRVEGHDEPVWAPFEKRLSGAKMALLSSAGLFVQGEQESFDLQRERGEPGWGDPSWRAIPASTAQGELGMAHLHVNDTDTTADHEVSLPLRALDALVDDGIVGASAATHYSVMGYQATGLNDWRRTTGPEIAARLRREDVDALVLAPT
ncbi:MAG: glycine/sarcosine/betaine reductase selenoprotein B family protein, partial [Actinomycetota bacterium]|nr:glycine/sarcosine/betaine reductase selenoprotein B family protein [Actinomycetota bacterium]